MSQCITQRVPDDIWMHSLKLYTLQQVKNKYDGTQSLCGMLTSYIKLLVAFAMTCKTAHRLTGQWMKQMQASALEELKHVLPTLQQQVDGWRVINQPRTTTCCDIVSFSKHLRDALALQLEMRRTSKTLLSNSQRMKSILAKRVRVLNLLEQQAEDDQTADPSLLAMSNTLGRLLTTLRKLYDDLRSDVYLRILLPRTEGFRKTMYFDWGDMTRWQLPGF